MELVQLSSKRGIYSFYNGKEYVIYSTYYGVVAYSSNIERKEEDDKKEVQISFNICQWYGYWDLKSIITRGIKKLENRYVERKVIIDYNTIEGTDNSLENEKYLFFELKDRNNAKSN